MISTHRNSQDLRAVAPDDGVPLVVRLLGNEPSLDAARLAKVQAIAAKDQITFEESLIRTKLVSEQRIAETYAAHYLAPLFLAPHERPPRDEHLASLLPPKLCRDHLIAPVAASDQELQVAFFTPDSLLLIDELKLLTGREVRPLFAPLSAIEGQLAVLYESADWVPSLAAETAEFQALETAEEGGDASSDAADEVIHLDQPPPLGRDGRIIRYVNQVFEQALTRGASDIHIEPFENTCRVRLRIDGRLTDLAPPPLSMFVAVVSRIKVLAKMDIAEKRVPQDGSLALRTGERRVDMRANTCPTIYGEKVVLRVLDKNAIPLQLAKLGLDQRQEKDLSESIRMPHGLMLVTGPTGSGKSTTLYSCLNFLNKSDVNICTVEDPVEYKFTGINQVQTRNQVGLTFASALRAFLRQDPDVIMVGEVRDGETAEICLRAALTGHFVLSTLHTNDALAAVSRLADMGIEPFLLASTLRVIVAQRLLRRLCTQCREPDTVGADTAARMGLAPDQTIYRPRGCKHCRDSGYKGRLGVFEVIRITRRLGELIQSGAPLEAMRTEAAAQGMKLLGESAAEQVAAGLTSLEEALTLSISDKEL